MNFPLEHGANIDSADKRGNTALHLAAKSGFNEVVEILLQIKANVNCINDSGLTPLLIVALEDAKQDNKDKFHLMNTLIIEGANVNAITPAGKTVIESLLAVSPRGIDPEVFTRTLYLLCKKGANKESIDRVPWKSHPNAK